MAIVALVTVLLLAAAIVVPQWWVRRVLKRHQVERPDLGGTGSDLARHLLDQAGLRHVKVELSPVGDHYDPEAEAVRLTLPHYDGRSVAALAVATHEVSHALQHRDRASGFMLRQRLAPLVVVLEMGAQVTFFALPIMALLFRSPALIAANMALVVLLLAGRLLYHLVTLPVELDASYGRALPILEAGRFLPAKDLPAAREVLGAAAWTYVAAALLHLFNIARLIRILR